MSRISLSALAVLGAAAALPLTFAGTASAATVVDGTTYFSTQTGTFNCSITQDGNVGCDIPDGRMMSINLANAGSATLFVPIPFPVHEVVIDVPWAPAHPAFDAGTPHTLPGGNPELVDTVNYAGASCSPEFHGSFSCTSKGHKFSYYESITGS